MLQPHHIDPILRAALAEDIPYLDLTTDYTIPADMTSEAKWVAKADGVLCGVDIALRVFSLLDAPAGQEVTYRTFKHDGDRVCKGDILATLSGNTRCLLKGERTALNLLQHLSGIATAAARLVKLVEGTAAAIADTRKTLPGLRALQKYAVTCGGGVNHRFSLSDGVLLKDNHIDAMGGIAAAVAAV
ncbi:MAG: carboxylating nicotinate-nucleotide diphosphorylase, partial [Oscillospiraceae bacterium]|nr:carboxylating nicotinate-nucleotide diphosphorylase [Oscillospiraceae bacterium]